MWKQYICIVYITYTTVWLTTQVMYFTCAPPPPKVHALVWHLWRPTCIFYLYKVSHVYTYHTYIHIYIHIYVYLYILYLIHISYIIRLGISKSDPVHSLLTPNSMTLLPYPCNGQSGPDWYHTSLLWGWDKLVGLAPGTQTLLPRPTPPPLIINLILPLTFFKYFKLDKHPT